MPFKLTFCNFCCSRLEDGSTDNVDNVTLSAKDGNQETETEPQTRYVFENPMSESSLLTLPPEPSDESMGIYKSLYSFEARTEEEISFVEKDLFRVTERLGEWWKAEKIVDGVVVASGVVPCNYLIKEDAVDVQPWYFGKLNRFEAQNLLHRSENHDGAFLVRLSDKDEVGYVLSVKTSGNVKHLRIEQGEDGCFYVLKSQTFPALEALVNYHRSHSVSTISKLTEPCARRKPEVQNLSHITEDEWQLPKSDFTLEHKLGSGHFSDVYRGKWKGRINVAIKILKDNDTLDHREFQMETQMLKRLRHRHLISLFAICTESFPFYIITEFMEKGNLRNLLKGPEGQALDSDSLTDMALQVADGMAYLESKNSIHRDLAAQNVLVGEGNLCKVGDFGLARVIKEPFYTSATKAIPYKWTAPEALSHGRFSSKSDVWSFGVLLYEIFTYGATPYPAFNNSELYDQINSGYRMPCPDKCPEHIYDIMKKCWSSSPEDRPNFKELKSLLQPRRSIEWCPENCV